MKASIARWSCLVWLVVSGVASAQSAGDVRIGVARFETAGPPGVEFPDVATLLADRIGTLGVSRIVGPSQLGADANASPPDASVTKLAGDSGVDWIVVGRTTQIGGQLSIDVRLHSGRTGESARTYVAEVGRTSQIAPVVETLARQVIQGSAELLAATQPAKPAVSAAGNAPPRAAVAKPKPARRQFDNDKPISIKSKSLEATDVDGRRRLVFTGNVRVTQDDVKMSSNSLTADYPQGASQPSRMVAKGSVRVTQSGQEVRCDTGTYKRAEGVLTCCGNAQLLDGPNRVRGSCIEFDLNGSKVRVEDAVINIQPESESAGTGGS